ncbi:MAG TPA: 50S ribosomal protein L10 [Bacilli bacterium]|nr:50S ribosomal protein L10 [Bacilli bacterium]
MNQNNLTAKQVIVDEVVEKAKANNAMIVFEYRGLTVRKISELRKILRENNAEMAIYKNSLVERAAEKLGKPELNDMLTGPNAFVFSNDVIKGPNIIRKFAIKNDQVVIKGGLIEGRVVDAESVKTIAKLPGREGLISMFLSVLNAPVRQFAATVKAVADAQN